MEKEIRYDAFISYRHCEPDTEIAVRLHRKLENYRLPKDVAKKIGRSRLSRVFRDEAELAVSADLSAEINKALLNSDYLIAICSPEYLKSEWCRKEIEFFLQHKDRKHVLLVLADGEPESAFPPVMLYEDVYRTNYDGTTSVYRVTSEPLAADCRAETRKARKELTDKAVTRLVAAICGVGYDDLEQRQRKAKTMRRTRRTLIAFGILMAVLAICLVFLVKISQQNALIKQRYADSLAAISLNLLADGRREDAVYVARSALSGNRTPDYSEAATQALTKALGLYDLPGFGCDKDILIPFSASYDLIVSPSGEYAAIRGLDYSNYLIDPDDGNVIFSYEEEEFQKLVFDGDQGCIIKRGSGNFKYLDLDDMTETDLGFSHAGLFSNPCGEGYAAVLDDRISFYEGTDHICDLFFSDHSISSGVGCDKYVRYSVDRHEAYVVCLDYDMWHTSLFAVDLDTGAINNVTLASEGLLRNLTTDGNTIVWIVQDEFSVKLCRQSFYSSSDYLEITIDSLYICTISVLGNDIVTCDETAIKIYNSDLVQTDYVPCEDYISHINATDEGLIIPGFSVGVYIVKDGECRHLIPEGREDLSSFTQYYSNGTLYLAEIGEDHITFYTDRTSDYVEVFDGNFESIEYYSFGDRRVKRFENDVIDSDPGYDEDRICRAVLCENADMGIIQLWDGQVNIYDTETLRCVKTIYSVEGLVSGFYYDDELEYYYISASDVEVYDKDMKKIYEIEGCRLLGFDLLTRDPIVVSLEPGSGEQFYRVEPVTYEDLIGLADDILDGYELDERIKEQYSIE